MEKRILLVPAIGLFATAPVMSQDAAGEVAGEVTEDAVRDNPRSPPALVIPPPAPYGTRTPPPAPAPPGDYTRPAMPTDFFAITPKQADYPATSWTAGEEGTVYYSVEVTPEGTPSDCVVLESSGHPELDRVTCDVVMARGQFDPALDRDGNPIAGNFSEYYTWRKEEPEFPGSATVRVRFTLDETGQAVNCEVLEQTGVLSRGMKRSFEREPCPPGRRNRTPYRDENGNPVAKEVTLAFQITVEDPDR